MTEEWRRQQRGLKHTPCRPSLLLLLGFCPYALPAYSPSSSLQGACRTALSESGQRQKTSSWFKAQKGNRNSLKPERLCTLQVFRSISLCRFSCSSDSFSFWTKVFMCSGKSSTDKYSAEGHIHIHNKTHTHLLHDKNTTNNLVAIKEQWLFYIWLKCSMIVLLAFLEGSFNL